MYGPKWPFLLILFVCRPGVVVVKIIRTSCVLGRAPRTRRLCQIFMSGVGLPDVHKYSAG